MNAKRICKIAIDFLMTVMLLILMAYQFTINQEASIGLFAMDTYISISAYGDEAETALTAAESKIIEFESIDLGAVGKGYAADGFDLILITEENERYITEGLEKDFTLDHKFKSMTVGVVQNEG